MINDPKLIASIAARADSRHAHHEGGHAVAAVVKGGRLIEIVLGIADWTTSDDNDELGYVHHQTRWADKPFVTYAGIWAEAMWYTEHDGDDLFDALEYVMLENSDGDTAKIDERFGDDRWPEREWMADLEPLWPVVKQVAALLIDGVEVTHEIVEDLLDDSATQ